MKPLSSFYQFGTTDLNNYQTVIESSVTFTYLLYQLPYSHLLDWKMRCISFLVVARGLLYPSIETIRGKRNRWFYKPEKSLSLRLCEGSETYRHAYMHISCLQKHMYINLQAWDSPESGKRDRIYLIKPLQETCDAKQKSS